MSEVAFEADRSNSVEFGVMPQTMEQRTDSNELSLDELDEVSGGLPALLMVSLLTAYGARALLGGSRYL